MKNKLFYLFISSLCLLTFISCHDDEDTSIKLYCSSEKVNSIEVTSVGEAFVEVRDAIGAYTVKSSNNEVATAELNEHLIINIKGIKEGNATITVIDSENRSATLNVEVVTQTQSILIRQHEVLVKAENPTTEDQVVIDKIKSEIISQLPLQGGVFKLIYTSGLGGTLIYYPDADKLNEKIEGTFKWVDSQTLQDGLLLNLSYNDKEYVYIFGSSSDLTTRMTAPSKVYMILDFTSDYSQMTKPKITKAMGGFLVSNSN